MERVRIGVDVGGTKIEAVVIRTKDDPAALPDVLARTRVPTDAARGYEHVVEATRAIVLDVAKQAKLPGLPPIGVGMPGSTTTRRPDGARADEPLVKNSNTTCLNGRPFRGDVARALGAPVAFANDANCFALAEATFGAAVGARVAFGVIMGTGVGGGVVFRERDGALTVWDGAMGIAGEWGHVSLDPANGPACYCGRRGCVERYLSGPAIEERYAAKSGARLALKDIASRAGDPRARALMDQTLDETMDAFGRALATVLDVLDPDVVVLGGGVSNVDALYDAGISAVRRWVFSDVLETRIVKHALGDSAGVLGAALLRAPAP